jgi:hypothetical protein
VSWLTQAGVTFIDPDRWLCPSEAVPARHRQHARLTATRGT